MEDLKPFVEGEVVYLDSRPYGIFRTRIVKITKTLIRIKDSNVSYDLYGRRKGCRDAFAVGERLVRPNAEMDKLFLFKQAISALFQLGKHPEDIVESDQRLILEIYGRMSKTEVQVPAGSESPAKD